MTLLDILYLEDDARDADLVKERLETEGVTYRITRVETEAEFRAALERGGYSLILADYTLPSFDGISALKIALKKRPELPFIFVSGTLDEELAIEALKIGATDYVFKTKISRLLHSVRRALREGEERTERLRAEAALRRSEVYLAEAQRLSHTGSFGWNIASGEIYWTPETFRIFGLQAPTAVTLERILERTHPEDRLLVRRVMNAAMTERKEFGFEHRLLMPDGTVKHIRVVAHPSPSGEEFVGAITDITENKRSQEALRTSQTELAHVTRLMTMGELAGSIAHEVNQPLSAIVASGSACIRWLNGAVPNLAEARETAERIVRDAKRAGDVIHRIRALTRKKPTEKERLDLNMVIKEVLAFAKDEILKNRISLRTELHGDLAPVLGDRIQLQQLVLNLIMNGIEAMSPVGDHPRELAITTRNGEPDQVLVTVRDSGVGIDPKTSEKIFEAFYTTKAAGMGMGLSISRSIVHNHGGRLWAVASDPGPGTTLQFTVPAMASS